MVEVEEYDERENLIYYKDDSYERRYEYDENNNRIHCKSSSGWEYWKKFDENNREIYWKDFLDNKCWYKYDNGERIEITQQEFEQIKYKEEEKEFLSREEIPRFDLMEF